MPTGRPGSAPSAPPLQRPGADAVREGGFSIRVEPSPEKSLPMRPKWGRYPALVAERTRQRERQSKAGPTEDEVRMKGFDES